MPLPCTRTPLSLRTRPLERQHEERIEVTVPATALRYGLGDIVATPRLLVSPSGASAELGGSLLNGGLNHQEALRTQSSTITITLVGAEWGPYVQFEDRGNGPTSDLLAGVRSAQNEPDGFNNRILPRLGADRVTMSLDRRTVTIRIPAEPSYRVSRPETITVTLPRGDPSRDSSLWTVLYDKPLVARPTIRLNPPAGSAVLSGEPLADGVDELWISLRRPIAFDIHLSGDTWAADVGEEDYGLGGTSALLGGISAASDDDSGRRKTGFDEVIKPTLSSANVARLSDTRVRITIRDFYDFDIDQARPARRPARHPPSPAPPCPAPRLGLISASSRPHLGLFSASSRPPPPRARSPRRCASPCRRPPCAPRCPSSRARRSC